jgi:hypothetical protein
MPPYRLADLSAEQMQMIESLENEIGVTLVAYEPGGEHKRPITSAAAFPAATPAADADDENQRILDSLVDAYRTHQPHI